MGPLVNYKKKLGILNLRILFNIFIGQKFQKIICNKYLNWELKDSFDYCIKIIPE